MRAPFRGIHYFSAVEFAFSAQVVFSMNKLLEDSQSDKHSNTTSEFFSLHFLGQAWFMGKRFDIQTPTLLLGRFLAPFLHSGPCDRTRDARRSDDATRSAARRWPWPTCRSCWAWTPCRPSPSARPGAGPGTPASERWSAGAERGPGSPPTEKAAPGGYRPFWGGTSFIQTCGNSTICIARCKEAIPRTFVWLMCFYEYSVS